MSEKASGRVRAKKEGYSSEAQARETIPAVSVVRPSRFFSSSLSFVLFSFSLAMQRLATILYRPIGDRQPFKALLCQFGHVSVYPALWFVYQLTILLLDWKFS